MSEINSSATSSNTLPSRRVRKSKHQLYDDVEEMMYGFGDKWPPDPHSVELVEALTVKYIQEICREAQEVADFTSKLDKNCFLFVIRKDRRKFTRAVQLLKANDEIRRVQKSEIASIEDSKPAEANVEPPSTV
jgi:transcription initiation factor TFIID subunit 13